MVGFAVVLGLSVGAFLVDEGVSYVDLGDSVTLARLVWAAVSGGVSEEGLLFP